MKKIISYIVQAVVLLNLLACEKWLDRDPSEILLDKEVWNDPKLAESVLANLYNRLDPQGGFTVAGFLAHTDVDEGMWSGGLGGNNDRNTRVNFPYNYRNYWSYGLVRDINLFLEKVSASTKFTAGEKEQLLAEGRFIRAYVYFLHVRAMGGVPLILKTYTYTGPQDVEGMRVPRSTETEVYEFIAVEIDEIKDKLGNANSKTRANKWVALALKSRAMLYAASIANYNNLMPSPISTPGGEVGIPADKAEEYYEQSLSASKKIIESGKYGLYNENPNKSENFYEVFTKKEMNSEVVWAYDFAVPGKNHTYTFENIPRSMRESAGGSSGLTPVLNLVEAFDYLDGSPGVLKTTAPDGDFIYYTNPEDIFADKDPRLGGTVIYPGATFSGKSVSMQAGVMEWVTNQYVVRQNNQLGSRFRDGGLLVGLDGPLPNAANVTNTGFNVRKYLDAKTGAAQQGIGSDLWWVRFRYAEILLNAAEAAFELGRPEALTYINELRERAGFGHNSLSALTIEKIRQERRVELAFEEHRWWDLKRWRIAHEVFDGQNNSATAEKWALWPYRVFRPGDPSKHNKYVFQKRVAPRFTRPLFFRMGNYYANIPQGALNANPLLVKNPFH